MIWIETTIEVMLTLDLAEHTTSVPFSPIIVLGTSKVDMIGTVPLGESLEILNVIPIGGYDSIITGDIIAVVVDVTVLVPISFSTSGIVTVHLREVVNVVHSNNNGSPGQTDTVSRGRSDDIIFFLPVRHQTDVIAL